MAKKSIAALKHDADTTEELVGVLTAISLVSKRLAKKLILLEQRSAENGGAKEDAGKQLVSAHAD